jgi:hypothetical protein
MSGIITTARQLYRSVEQAETDTLRKGCVRAIVSDDSCDRYRTVFLPSGCDFRAFVEAGGPVLWNHGASSERGSVPVANITNIGVINHKGRMSLVATARFWETDDFCRGLKQAYEDQRMRAWSISAIPTESSPPTPAELRARPDWQEARTIYRTFELTEVSAVAVGGSANALTLSVERSAREQMSSPLPRVELHYGEVSPGRFEVWEVDTLRVRAVVCSEEIAKRYCS